MTIPSDTPGSRSTVFEKPIAIVGLGYVGLPLSLQFAKKGVEVVGLDIDEQKVEKLNRGESYIHHVSDALICSRLQEKTFRASNDFSEIKNCRAVILCLPTPLNKHREPDLSFVLSTAVSIAPFIQPGMLIVLESTTYPGTTEEDLLQVLESHSKLKAGYDFHLAYSPEREDPGNPTSQVATIPKIVGGFTLSCLQRATELYSQALDKVVPVSSCRVAEATKLLENIFRGVNIALVNELKMVYDAMNIDVWEVIEAAKTKPFGYMPFYPGPGLGGHCIPIDPFYLTWKAREFGMATRFIELAGEINTSMPQYVIQRLESALSDKGKPIRGSRILILGLAYKANVDDDRESPGYVFLDRLSKRGALVSYHDPYIPCIKPSREHMNWVGLKSTPWDRDNIKGADAVLVVTAHRDVNYQELGQWADLIIDTRDAMRGIPVAGRLVKA